MREKLRKLLKEADKEACKIVQNRFPSDVRTVWELLADQLIAKDVVQVVRYKDCTQYNGHRYCHYFAQAVLDNDFCSYGERRTDG